MELQDRTRVSNHVETGRPPSFQLQNVGRRWEARTGLDDLTLSITPGELVVLGGPSGGGKSTFLSILCGALRPTSGTMLVDGADLSSFSPRALRHHRARCATIAQNASLVPQLNVHRNVVAGCLPNRPWHFALLSALWPLERERVASILAEVGIGDRQWELPSQMSGGQRQRVSIARGLIAGGSVILADEPTSCLDPVTAKEVTALIFEYAQQRGATLIFCTHWIEIGLKHATRVLGIKNGRLIIDTPPDQVKSADLDRLYEGSHEREVTNDLSRVPSNNTYPPRRA